VTGPAPLDLPSAQALARLAMLVDDARRRASDRSEPGSHVALIVLDGTVEYALWLVAQLADAAPKEEKPSLHKLEQSVRRGLEERDRPWAPRGRQGVDQLRRARNPAQHASVQFEPSQLDAWSEAATAYIDSLLVAALGIGVADLWLGLAVSDSLLKGRLVEAEQTLRSDEPQLAFDQAWSTFESALARWREQQGHVDESMAGIHVMGGAPGWGHEALQRMDTLERTSDALVFAPDAGEYVSLAHARDLRQSTGFAPDAEDARRAVRFACSWIVRWETWERGYPAERWTAWEATIEPPRIGDGKTPTIASVEPAPVTGYHGQAWWAVIVQLGNLPERGRGDWGHDLIDCLAEARATAQLRPLPIQRVSGPGPLGRLVVEFEPDIDADEFVRALNDAIVIADQRYRRRHDARRRRHEQVAALSSRWTDMLASASGGLVGLDGIVTRDVTDGEHFIARLRLTTGDRGMDLLAVAEVLRSCGGALAAAGVRDGVLEIETPPDDADLSEIREGVARAAQELQRRRSQRSAQDLRFQHFALRLRELLPKADADEPGS
jgi:hypothetical protein